MKAVKENEKKGTMADALTLSNAINDLIKSVPTVSGKMAYALTKNGKKMIKFRQEAQKNFDELVLKHVVISEESGQPEQVEKPTSKYPFKYKSDDDQQLFEAGIKEQEEKEIVFPEIYKIDKADLEALNIPLMHNPDFGLLVDELSK